MATKFNNEVTTTILTRAQMVEQGMVQKFTDGTQWYTSPTSPKLATLTINHTSMIFSQTAAELMELGDKDGIEFGVNKDRSALVFRKNEKGITFRKLVPQARKGPTIHRSFSKQILKWLRSQGIGSGRYTVEHAGEDGVFLAIYKHKEPKRGPGGVVL